MGTTRAPTRRVGRVLLALLTGVDVRAPGAAIRRVRWPVALAVALLLATDYPDLVPGPEVPPLATGAAFVGLLCLANALSYAEGAVGDAAVARRLALAQLVLDTGLAIGIYWVFLFDPTSAVWALAILAIVEAAVRHRLRGALVVWLVTAASFLLGEVYAAHLHSGAALGHSGVLLRAAMTLVVALACGTLAENLTRQVVRERDANVAAKRRAELLGMVSAAARRMSVLEPEEVLAGIVDAAVDVGFDAGEICLLDERARTWASFHPVGLPGIREGDTQPLDSGVAGEVYRRNDSVLIDDYSRWHQALPHVAARGFRKVLAHPVWSGQDLAAVLTVATHRDDILPEEAEALELLAAQASRALEIAHRYREREELQRQLAHQAFHDALTGLPNRLLFHDRLDHALAKAARQQLGIGLLFSDLDGFKEVNDRHGHDTGDALLVEIAARLSACVRPGDTVARLGGDEFVVILEGVVDLSEAEAIAARVLAAVEQPVTVRGVGLGVSASVGVSWAAPGTNPGAMTLLQQADRAMYQAKEAGKARSAVYAGGA